MFLGEARGWGFGMSVFKGLDDPHAKPGRFGWDGGYGTSWYSDPRRATHRHSAHPADDGFAAAAARLHGFLDLALSGLTTIAPRTSPRHRLASARGDVAARRGGNYLRNNSARTCRCRKTPIVFSESAGSSGACRQNKERRATMRFMMLMIPQGLRDRRAGRHAARGGGRRDDEIQRGAEGGRRPDHAGRPAPALDGRAGFVRRRQAGRDRRPVHRSRRKCSAATG